MNLPRNMLLCVLFSVVAVLACGKVKSEEKAVTDNGKTIGAVNNNPTPKVVAAAEGFKIVSVSPTEESKAVGRANRVEVVFNEILKPIDDPSKILRLQDGPQMYVAGTYEVEGAILRFIPTQALKANVPHVVNLAGKFQSESGRALEVSKSWNFQTSLTNDTALPTLLTTFPTQAGSWVFGMPFIFQYDEALHADSLQADVDVFDTNGAQLEANTRLTANSFFVDLAKPLPTGQKELRFVSKVMDLDKNIRVLDKKLLFQVVDSVPSVPFELISITPSSSTDRRVRDTVTLKFTRPLDPTSINPSNLWLVNKNLSPAINHPYKFIVDGDSVKLNYADGLNYAAQYEIGSSGGLKSILGGNPFASSVVTLSTFTTQSALTITSSSFADGATDVSLSTPLQLIFGKSVPAESLSLLNIRDEFDNKVPGVWAASSGGTVATFSGQFSKSKSYKFELNASFRATDDSSFASDSEFNFSMVKDQTWENSAKPYTIAACAGCHASFRDRDVVLSRKTQIYTSVNTGSMPKTTPPAPYATQGVETAFLLWLNSAN